MVRTPRQQPIPQDALLPSPPPPVSLREQVAEAETELLFDANGPLFPEEREEPEEDLNDFSIVLHGYGVVSPKKVNYLGGRIGVKEDGTGGRPVAYEFVGGICEKVPNEVAEQWKKIPGMKVRVLPQKGTTAQDIARAAGIRPMDPAKLAAQIAASDMGTLIRELGIRRTRLLLEKLEAAVRAGRAG